MLSHKADLEAVQDLLHRQEVGHAIVEIDAEDDANGLVLTVLFPDDERAGVAWAGKSIGHGIADHQDIIEVDRAFEGRVIHEDFDSPAHAVQRAEDVARRGEFHVSLNFGVCRPGMKKRAVCQQAARSS